MEKIQILVTGSNGQLGKDLRSIAQNYPDYKFDFRTRETLSITSSQKVIDTLIDKQYDYCINCAAYTQVDKAESDLKNCYDINTYAPMLIAQICKETETKLIHISSDYVYHTDPERPLLETDECQPKGIYAKSKLEGEANILEASNKHIVLRTSWLYSTHGNNFVKTMLNLAESKDELSIVNDQIGCPTYAFDLATTIVNIISTIEKSDNDINFGGIYNYSNESPTNWHEFADEIFKLSNITIKLEGIPTSQYPTPAPRPLWSVMDLSKMKSTFGIEIRTWREALKEMLNTLNPNQ